MMEHFVLRSTQKEKDQDCLLGGKKGGELEYKTTVETKRGGRAEVDEGRGRRKGGDEE